MFVMKRLGGVRSVLKLCQQFHDCLFGRTIFSSIKKGHYYGIYHQLTYCMRDYCLIMANTAVLGK